MSEVSSETRFLHAVEMGLGAWQWGDRVVWQFGQNYSDNEVRDAFQSSIHEGIRLIDTAEAYGNGLSERLLGKFIQETDQPVLIATKYFPYPWRFTSSSVPRALKGSLERLGVERHVLLVALGICHIDVRDPVAVGHRLAPSLRRLRFMRQRSALRFLPRPRADPPPG